MSLAAKSLTILAAWFLFALFAGPLIGRYLAADRRDLGADGAFDTLPDLSESTPIFEELSERHDWALWEHEYYTRGADQ